MRRGGMGRDWLRTQSTEKELSEAFSLVPAKIISKN